MGAGASSRALTRRRQASALQGWRAVVGFMCILALAGGAFGAGVEAADQAALDAARGRIETLRKGDFTVKLVDETGAPVEGTAQVRLTKHAFAFAADLGDLVERSTAGDAAASRALLWIEELFDAVAAKEAAAPAALWARDREKARVEEKSYVLIAGAGAGASPQTLNDRLDLVIGDRPVMARVGRGPGGAGAAGAMDWVQVATICFSKPVLKGVAWEGIVETREGAGDGLIRRDGEKTPAYEALRGLLKATWRTEWRGRIEGGKIAFRGFYGTYAVEADGYHGTTFSCNSAAEREATAVMVKHNGE